MIFVAITQVLDESFDTFFYPVLYFKVTQITSVDNV